MRLATLVLTLWFGSVAFGAAVTPDQEAPAFPKPVSAYGPASDGGAWAAIIKRGEQEPLNVVVTLFFLAAICHTFLAPRIMHYAHHLRDEHHRKYQIKVEDDPDYPGVSFKAEMLHFLGEIEAVFGIWVIPVMIAISANEGWHTAEGYIHNLSFTEPVFVVVIMTIASSRPILVLSERVLSSVVRLFGGSTSAWWFCLLSLSPLLGSFITEPAAMTISALLLREKFFSARPPVSLAYATVGLLFVNISIGGALTNFAAPPVLMVARVWDWDTLYMLRHFGEKAVLCTFVNTIVYLIWFRKPLKELSTRTELAVEVKVRPLPGWVIVAHVLFLVWTVFAAHQTALIVGGFLIFMAFTEATQPHQDPILLRPALLVGFFLAGLVVHGGLQAWWIQPVLSSLSETTLMFGAMILTAFNDNAAITYLAAQVPNLSEGMKHAVVAGALIGGGLTVIANAPNPAGQALLQKYFPDGLSPLRLFFGAVIPTAITALIFALWRS